MKGVARRESALERELALQIRAAKLPRPLRQHRPLTTRRYRADFCWPHWDLVVEVQGGTWSAGRHVRGSGYEADCERLNLLQLAGWRVFYVTSKQIQSGEALDWIRQGLAR